MTDIKRKPGQNMSRLRPARNDAEAENRLLMAAKGWARKNGSSLRALAYAARLTEFEADTALVRLREKGLWTYRTPIGDIPETRIRPERLVELAAEYAACRLENMLRPCLASRALLERAEIMLASALDIRPGFIDYEGWRYRVICGTLCRERSPKRDGYIGPSAAPVPFVKTMHRVMIKESGS